MLRRWHDRVWRWLAGGDGVRAGLPCAELLAPLPLFALAVVAANDWWWKGGGLVPPWLTGKISDVAGVIVAPLAMTAIAGLLTRGAVVLGAKVDPSLRLWKLATAIAITAAAVIATKLSSDIASAVARRISHHARIVADPTDLIALPALGLSWWHGRRTIARVPYGRVAWIVASGGNANAQLADVIAAGALRPPIERLAHAITDGASADDIDTALAVVRASGTERRSLGSK